MIKGAPKTLRQAVTEPFHEFVGRQGWRGAVLVLAFIFLYKLGDSLCTALATPFYLDMGFTKTDIGLIAKHAGLWPAVIGALLGGLWMVRLGINRALWLFGVVQLVSIFGFAWLAAQGHYASIAAGARESELMERTSLLRAPFSTAEIDPDARAGQLSAACLPRYLGFSRLQSPAPGLCLLYTSPSPRDRTRSRMPSSA